MLGTQVIADLYERYVELIGTPVGEEGDTMPDGYVAFLSTTQRWPV